MKMRIINEGMIQQPNLLSTEIAYCLICGFISIISTLEVAILPMAAEKSKQGVVNQ